MAEIGHRDPTGKQRPASDRPRKSPVPTGFCGNAKAMRALRRRSGAGVTAIPQERGSCTSEARKRRPTRTAL